MPKNNPPDHIQHPHTQTPLCNHITIEEVDIIMQTSS